MNAAGKHEASASFWRISFRSAGKLHRDSPPPTYVACVRERYEVGRAVKRKRPVAQDVADMHAARANRRPDA